MSSRYKSLIQTKNAQNTYTGKGDSMFITYQELLSLREMEQAEVVAGREGLSKTIKWCHVIEIQNVGDWVTANLLVFTSGVALTNNTEEALFHMVNALYRKQAAGLVLGIGAYIAEVPASVIARADELKFPIIALPEAVKFVDVTYKIGNLIFEKMATNNRQHLLLENVITDSGHINYEAELEYYGYLRDIAYRVVVIHKSTKGKISNDVADEIQLAIANIRNQIHRKIFLLNRMNQFVLLVPDTKGLIENEFTFEDILQEFMKVIEQQEDASLYETGVSDWAEHPSQLPKCYEQVRKVFERGRYFFPDKRVLYYSDLGIFSMVDMDDTSELEHIMQNALGDLSGQEELINTLQTYIECDMNMQETADRLFVHVNTMKYRLKKIDAMLPEGLSKSRLFRIQTGIYLYRFLHAGRI